MARLISGGQTGVDRAALDVALGLGIPSGGWCPKGRLAEDGPIAARYPLVEIDSPDYPARTRRNVEDADATLVLSRGALSGGTALTLRIAQELGRPSFVVDLRDPADLVAAREWIARTRPRTLNVAGPRESENAGIYDEAVAFLLELIG